MAERASVEEISRLTPGQALEFDRLGYLLIPNALSFAQVDRLLTVHDRFYEDERAAGRLAADGSLHCFAFVLRDPEYLELLDLPTTFPLVCALLGWNIYLYHSHLDVHPPVTTPPKSWWGWHQDGGRQNLEIETEPTRPLLSVKIAYFLSDVSQPGRGNFSVIPGSHRLNRIPRPASTDGSLDQPTGAIPILAEPGTAVLFDRRLWHARTENTSSITRKAVFLAYTYRWIRPRDDYVMDPAWLAGLPPVRRQLLGEGLDAMSYWGLGDGPAPLREWLRDRGLLDEALASNR
jgi:ectoine hydroxylase-related dioxygenase (phytanoyl-CoA dioxygenase family)